MHALFYLIYFLFKLFISEYSGFIIVFKAYLMRGAGAVIHSHGIETCIATMLNPGAKEFRVNPLVHVSVSMSMTM